jgi:hypothetical protein
MRTALVEAVSAQGNWGKFLVGEFDDEELGRRTVVEENAGAAGWRPSLLLTTGWGHDHRLVLDLATGEGAIFLVSPRGYVKADLEKHRVWVCPLFEPFLQWLYDHWQAPYDVAVLPQEVRLDHPLELRGHRRRGPGTGLVSEGDGLYRIEEGWEVLAFPTEAAAGVADVVEAGLAHAEGADFVGDVLQGFVEAVRADEAV